MSSPKILLAPPARRFGRTARVPAARSIALPLAVLAAAGCGPHADADASAQARTAIEACGGRSGPDKQDCYEERLLDRLAESGTGPALEMLEEIARADRDVVRDAHVYTHGIGIEAYDGARPVSEVFSECSELFQSGCYHGVIQAHFMAAGNANEDTVQGLCEDFKGPEGDQFLLFQCLHGLGHGLTMLYGYHLPTALDGCDLLRASWDRESCYGGVFMENIVSATNPHHVATELVAGRGGDAGDGRDGDGADARDGDAGDARTGDAEGHAMADHAHGDGGASAFTEGLEPFEQLRDDDPHYPCSILDDRYLTACYMMQTSVMLSQTGSDIGRAAEMCLDAPEAWRRTCYQSLGRDISAHTLQDPDDSLRECRKTPEEYREWCYVGLVKNFVDLTATTEAGFSFCTLVEESAKPRCHEAMGEQIGILHRGEAERRSACAASETPLLERSCLYGARVPTG